MLFTGLTSLIVVFLPISNASTLLNAQNPYVVPTDDWTSASVQVPGNWPGTEDAFVNVVKGAVNRVLGILALIALIILLYGGFLMVTSAGEEEKYKKGFTILKHAATGLLLIGVAWFVVSIIFWLANQITNAPGTAGTES